jgi:hypothetical protein
VSPFSSLWRHKIAIHSYRRRLFETTPPSYGVDPLHQTRRVLCVLADRSPLDPGTPVEFDFSIFDAQARKAAIQPRAKPKPLFNSAPSTLHIHLERSDAIEPLAPGSPLDPGSIPPFYGSVIIPKEAEAVDVLCKSPAITEDALAAFLFEYCKFPKCFAQVVLQTQRFTPDSFRTYWTSVLSGRRDPNERFFRVIAGPERNFIFPSDLVPFVRALVESHPSLARL